MSGSFFGRCVLDMDDSSRLEVAGAMLSRPGWVSEAHRRSFDWFVGEVVPDVVSRASGQVVRVGDSGRSLRIRFGRVEIERPKSTTSAGDVWPMMPDEARMRNDGYNLDVRVDVHVDSGGPEGWSECVAYRGVSVGSVPLLVGSSYCWLGDPVARAEAAESGRECDADPGGYFVHNGMERTIIMHERLAHNREFVFQRPGRGGISVECRSDYPNNPRSSSTTAVRVVPRSKSSPETLRVQLPYVSRDSCDAPLSAVMSVLGVASERDAFLLCTDSDLRDDPRAGGAREVLETSLRDVRWGSRTEALACVAEHLAAAAASRDSAPPRSGRPKRRRRVPSTEQESLDAAERTMGPSFLPHAGEGAVRKAIALGVMVRRLLRVHAGLDPEDDRDSFEAKRLCCVGDVFASHFQSAFQQFSRELGSTVSRAAANSAAHSRSGAISAFGANLNHLCNGRSGVTFTLRGVVTGSGGGAAPVFGAAGGGAIGQRNKGINQLVGRVSYMASATTGRRMLSTAGSEGKLTLPRQLHPSQMGLVCPSETPEGEMIGMMKNLSLGAVVTQGSISLAALLRDRFDVAEPALPHEPGWADAGTSVLVTADGEVVGTMTPEAASDAADALRGLRRARAIDATVSVVLEPGHLRVSCERGRIVQPLLVCGSDGRPIVRPEDARSLRWEDMLRAGLVEYVDAEEESACCVVADLDQETGEPPDGLRATHARIHASLMLGMCASMIPFSNHNQSPRNSYQSAMCKQAVGVPTTNQSRRMDRSSHALVYPQRPLVSTHALRHAHPLAQLTGVNVLLAIMCYGGYNMEDSIVMNRAAVQRGLFRSMSTCVIKEDVHGAAHERMLRPSDASRTVLAHDASAYESLGPDGLATPGEMAAAGDVLAGKVARVIGGSSQDHFDRSKVFKGYGDGQVDAVVRTSHEVEGKLVSVAKVRVVVLASPMVGDKFASRHAQKGVLGALVEQRDMPTSNETGLTPDIIVNPHAMPSRMTVGHILEMLVGKLAAATCTLRDGTSFSKVDVSRIAEELEAAGCSDGMGKEEMIDGTTGMLLGQKAFVGMIYYQMLKHMVRFKVHARACGRRAQLTLQPVDGRAKAGGLRWGEMEKDCVIAHGASAVLLDRMSDCSDGSRLHVERESGELAVADVQRGTYVPLGYHKTLDRSRAGAPGGVGQVRMAYASKLLMQEMQAMTVGWRLVCD